MGELKSFNVYHSYLEGLEPYGDAERGRLLTACLQYSMTGEVPELRGNEKYIFPSWKAQIDRDKEKYMVRCDALRENGKKGKNHWNWKGGITPQNQKMRSSLNYKIWRKKVFIRDNFTCQICGKRSGTLNAHHIKPWAQYPDKRFDIENGITLCKLCHDETHRNLRNIR